MAITTKSCNRIPVLMTMVSVTIMAASTAVGITHQAATGRFHSVRDWRRTLTSIKDASHFRRGVGLSSAKAVERRSTPPVISSGPRSRQSPSARASTLRSASWGNPHVH